MKKITAESLFDLKSIAQPIQVEENIYYIENSMNQEKNRYESTIFSYNLKTKEKIDEAMGGVLFIDEAYTLAKDGNDFGQEAIDTILKGMEDNRENFVVIVAGYLEPMNKFLESNPGLKSRFNKFIYFDDYTNKELFDIFLSLCDSKKLSLSKKAEEKLLDYLTKLCQNKPDNFANGREIRNLFERTYENQANRLSKLDIEELTDSILSEFIEEDLAI